VGGHRSQQAHRREDQGLAKNGKDFTGRSTTGAIEADVTLDKSGAVSVADMQIGPQKVKVERVYVNGSF
jgi:hypothetical protein